MKRVLPPGRVVRLAPEETSPAPIDRLMALSLKTSRSTESAPRPQVAFTVQAATDMKFVDVLTIDSLILGRYGSTANGGGGPTEKRSQNRNSVDSYEAGMTASPTPSRNKIVRRRIDDGTSSLSLGSNTAAVGPKSRARARTVNATMPRHGDINMIGVLAVAVEVADKHATSDMLGTERTITTTTSGSGFFADLKRSSSMRSKKSVNSESGSSISSGSRFTDFANKYMAFGRKSAKRHSIVEDDTSSVSGMPTSTTFPVAAGVESTAGKIVDALANVEPATQDRKANDGIRLVERGIDSTAVSEGIYKRLIFAYASI